MNRREKSRSSRGWLIPDLLEFDEICLQFPIGLSVELEEETSRGKNGRSTEKESILDHQYTAYYHNNVSRSTCTTTPPLHIVSVAWIHVGRQMLLTIHKHVVVKVPRFSVSHDNQKTWLLHISSVQQDDRGYYMCQVNTNPMISQVGFLQVVVPPNILDSLSTESTVAVREHQNITLTCKADGYPPPKLMWKREDGQMISLNKHHKVTVYDGEQLNLTRITRSEMGAYLCIATNGVPPTVSKRITVDVEFSPMIFVPNQLVGAPTGTNVTIDCHTEAYPRAMSYWFLGEEMILSNEKYATNIMENSYRAHMRLTIRNLTATDFGSYRCISKNSLGETEGSIRLYPIPKPSVAPKATEIKSSANKDGSAYIIRWSAPQLMVVAVQYILTGPYMPPYVPQTAN
ncbi:lachesin-like isoform X5 [Cataglyphis hispanica]|uniref:lachesin-like isoform X5 n=1 Tax=Cataglyphis hispanica TaxID=1086592 RepID=UPI0021806AB2|nr:lachesin-like isoform X5 [Cataglyphis hispanica]